jgi:excinuclease ABC subunit C
MKREVSGNLQGILDTLPKSPWVYQMKDSGGKVIYVGKAKNLSSRVNSYFQRTQELTVAKRQMVAKIRDIETLLCETEVEALVLETNLIKHLSPKYNILMKDDKNLAYIKIPRSPVWEIIKTRQRIPDGGEYFGPYVSAVEPTIRILKKIFRIRNCRVRFSNLWGKLSITEKAWKTIPCMDYYIWLCPAPCLLKEKNLEEHDVSLRELKKFLRWESGGIFETMQQNMREKAKNLQFEEAQSIKESIDLLQGLAEKQKVREYVEWDIDIVVMYEKYERYFIARTMIRSGSIVWVFRHEIQDILQSDEEELLTAFLSQQYIDSLGEDIPDILILQKDLQNTIFHTFLTSKNIKIEVPKIGPKKDLLDFTLVQLKEYAYKLELKTLEQKTLTRSHMISVLMKIGYPYNEKKNIIFECYDISHTDGHFTYASRVSIEDGKPNTSHYKKYKIRSLSDGMIDDFQSHREVMKRRTIEGLEFSNFPDLIIIDGGKWQLSSAHAGIREWYEEFSRLFPERIPYIARENIPLCSIAKREEEIFIPHTPKPILFEHGTSELRVLQKARDESHRFSITANRSARDKAMKKNILEEIPGIWPVTRKKLLKLAGSIDEIKNIKLDEIQKICTITQIQQLRDHWIFI